MLQNVAPRVDHPFPYESVNMIELDKALNVSTLFQVLARVRWLLSVV